MTNQPDTLVEWLRAQLDDDEQTARAADSSRWLPEDKGITFEYHADDFHEGEAQARLAADTRANQDHIARWDPKRALAEVGAKRRIIASIATVTLSPWPISVPPEYVEHLNQLMRLLALPYADRPGYRDEWRP